MVDWIKPWSKEAEQILQRLSREGRAYTLNSKIPKSIGARCKPFIDEGIIDITVGRKSGKHWIVLDEDWILVRGRFGFRVYKR